MKKKQQSVIVVVLDHTLHTGSARPRDVSVVELMPTKLHVCDEQNIGAESIPDLA